MIIMPLIYHLVPPQEWEKALKKGVHQPASLVSEGFIHFSTREQLLESATRFFEEYQELVVVEISEARLAPHLKYEPAGDGRMFPHYYQRLDLELVNDTRMLFRNAKGEWEWD
jgi:uncharacterized protein (DUF952 family)